MSVKATIIGSVLMTCIFGIADTDCHSAGSETACIQCCTSKYQVLAKMAEDKEFKLELKSACEKKTEERAQAFAQLYEKHRIIVRSDIYLGCGEGPRASKKECIDGCPSDVESNFKNGTRKSGT